MLSRSPLLVAALLVTHVLTAQGQTRGPAAGTGANIHDHLLIQTAKDVLREDADHPVEGSPYMTEEFTKGIVITAKRVFPDIEMRYNIHADVIEFRQNNQTYWLDPVPQIVRVDIGKLRLVVGGEDGSQRWGYYELLDSGEVMLMVRHRVAFQQGRPPQALESKATPARYTRMPEMYFYQRTGGLLTRVTNLKRLLADLPGDRQTLANFADSEDISVRKREDLLKLIRYCNAAVH